MPSCIGRCVTVENLITNLIDHMNGFLQWWMLIFLTVVWERQISDN